MGEVFVRCYCDDPQDRKVLIPLWRVSKIETNADGDDYVYTIDGEAYIPAECGNVYDSLTTLGESQNEG